MGILALGALPNIKIPLFSSFGNTFQVAVQAAK